MFIQDAPSQPTYPVQATEVTVRARGEEPPIASGVIATATLVLAETPTGDLEAFLIGYHQQPMPAVGSRCTFHHRRVDYQVFIGGLRQTYFPTGGQLVGSFECDQLDPVPEQATP